MSGHELPKSLGLFRLTVYGVGTIIGAGIYAVISPAAANAGSGIWISFLIAALVSSFTALSYAELASALPSAGAEHNFLKKAFPKIPALAFVVGLFLAIHGAATVGAVALTFANYFQHLIRLPQASVAIALIVLLTLLNIVGLKKASWVNVLFTVTQVVCLLILVVAGLSSENTGNQIGKVVSAEINWSGVFGASAILFFIYTGFEHMASLSEEAINAGRDLWKAFILSLIITTLVYIAVIFSVLTLMSPEEISKTAGPLTLAAEKRWGFLGPLITGAALMATANGVLSGSVSISRLLFGIARAGDFPKFLMRTTRSSKSPWIAALVVMVSACVLSSIGSLELVASLSSFGALMVFALVNASVIALRMTQPKLKRPFQIPGSIKGWPILPTLGILATLALATRYDSIVYGVFLIGILIGVVGYKLSKS